MLQEPTTKDLLLLTHFVLQEGGWGFWLYKDR